MPGQLVSEACYTGSFLKQNAVMTQFFHALQLPEQSLVCEIHSVK